MSAAELWAHLSAEGLVIGERPEPEPAGSPWFVRLMLGIAGWIGALFLLGFVGATLSFILDDGPSAMVAGVACCGAAYAMFRGLDGNDAAEQFALALSLAGQGLIVAGLGETFGWGDATFYLAIAAVEIALVWITPNFVHRFLAAAGAAIAMALAINALKLHGLATPVLCVALAAIWLDPARWATGGRLWRPIGYGIVVAIVLIETFRIVGVDAILGMPSRAASWMALHGWWIGRGLTGAVLVWVAVTLARREGFSPESRNFQLAVGGALLSAGLCMVAPGLGSALLILLLGYNAGNRLLVGAGILSLLGFTSHYYYSLHATLLEKSGIMAVTGIVLLAVSWFLRREETRHA